MADNIGGYPANDTMYGRTAAALAAWLRQHRTILHGLSALRALGPPGEEAVHAVLEVAAVACFRLSWELWATLAEGEGVDAEALLAEYAAISDIELARNAVWGPASGLSDNLRSLQP